MGLLAALVAAYLGAAVIGAVVQSAEPADPLGEPVTIYVATNGFHADIIVPRTSAARDWSDILRASPITSARLNQTRWVAFGWGSEAAYTQVGDITDLSPDIIFKALAFDRSVVHVVPLASIEAGDGVWPVEVSAAGYARLTRLLEDSFALNEAGAPIPVNGATHGYGDSFFRGRDRFSLFRSCNVWVGDALRAAGIRTGIWTPFSQALMWSAADPRL